MVGTTFLGVASTGSEYRLVTYGEYPALTRAPGQPTERVEGELYRVPVERLPALDEFEECPTLYQRQEIEMADGSRAFAYLIEPAAAEGLQAIAGGLWFETPSQRSDMGL
jgi:gamma-glutamylcyclotransferase (GGCT)/AIG2-like uncharacterized protein YtfP